MGYCSSCGANIYQGDAFCSKCGKSAGGERSGQVDTRSTNEPRATNESRVCPQCQGRGKIIHDPCNGTGKIESFVRQPFTGAKMPVMVACRECVRGEITCNHRGCRNGYLI
jgi:uncharacterized OB-fold protein